MEAAGFPFQVESLEDGIDDSIHRLHVETDRGPGAGQTDLASDRITDRPEVVHPSAS
jgi:hypothetical protein